jgi:allophanate hydrolase subunit 2
VIRIRTPSIATSVQDQGRFGHRMLGYCRSGAMDAASLAAANRLAGAAWRSAGIEFGPGGFECVVTAQGTLAFSGAPREGAPWWTTLNVSPGDRFTLGPPTRGMWSYLAIGGGVASPVVLGSRSTSVREGIGSWLGPGAMVEAGGQVAAPSPVDPLPMTGKVRVFGELSGDFTVGNRVDRMGYLLEGRTIEGGRADQLSEPLMPGCIQIPPGGNPIVLMAECPTVGGYTLGGVVHSADLRLVAQTPPGGRLSLVSP